jgi:Beta-ketoacyl synthase, N-terminal domain
MQVWIEGIGLRAPGLDGWEPSRGVLRGEEPYCPAPLNLPPSNLLPANERRRLVVTVRLSMLVGTDAFTHAGRDPAVTPTVFTSSGGDGETIHNILETLAANAFDVSPTRFHNSVHNAPSGYWGIATQARTAASSLCAHDASFGAGLLEAAAQAVAEHGAVGLIAYDLPYPEPLHAKRSIAAIYGVGLVLTAAPTTNSRARITIALTRDAKASRTMEEPALEAMRRGNPAARSLPLLAALAREEETIVTLDYLSDKKLVVRVAPGAS